MVSLVKWFFFAVTFLGARGVSDEEMQLPKLFHLDDYDRCLSRDYGLYCLGTFELAPKSENNTAYSLITNNQRWFSFDRKLLHRGYCLSSRCPSKELNRTLRFERCVNKHLRKYALTAHLKTLSYCRTDAERKAKEIQAPDLPQRIFLYILYLILFLNVVGTITDTYLNRKKNRLLVAWSLPSNWKDLTTIDDGASTAFTPVQSIKVLMHFVLIYGHSTLLHYMTYVYNPEAMEKASQSPMLISVRNGTAVVQVFVLISSFLTAYKILVTARRSAVRAWLILTWILKRIFRIAPVYLLVTGYAATWWPLAGDGPVWSPTVDAESAICRKKFWTHVLFVNNYVDPTEICLVQSWAMAVEIQLFLVSLLLTVFFIKLRVRAAPILGMMFIAVCVVTGIMAYTAGLLPMVKIIVPENLRVLFRGSPSFHLHMSLWSNLPACLLGQVVAHIYYEQQNKIKAKIEDSSKLSDYENSNQNNRLVKGRFGRISKSSRCQNENENFDIGFEESDYIEIIETNKVTRPDRKELKRIGEINQERCIEKNKSLKTTFRHKNESKLAGQENGKEWKSSFLLQYAHCLAIPSLAMWMALGFHVKDVDSKLAIALYVGMERVMFSVLCAWQLFQIITIKGPLGRLMSWRGWIVPSRLLFSVVMVHWCINVIIVAARPQPTVSSLFDIGVDWLVTIFYSFLMAIPLSLLVELPMKKVVDVIVIA